jgi:hypothetical protein
MSQKSSLMKTPQYVPKALTSDNFIRGGIRSGQVRGLRGLMSYYALLDNCAELKELDGWLLANLRKAINKRRKILNSKYGVTRKQFTKKELLDSSWYSHPSKKNFNPDPRLPSFIRGWRAARKYYMSCGLEGIDPPKYMTYS